MIYFDTDVLINLAIPQDELKHQKAKALYRSVTDKDRFFISLLCLQETAFVLKKLHQDSGDITRMLASFLSYKPVSYGIPELKRAIDLAKSVGFQHINDCIHTAVAETHCSELYTFNSVDFRRIRKHVKLKITIL